MIARWRRTDIVHAWLALECDYDKDGWLHERPSNQRRRESCASQIDRMGLSLSFPDELNSNARAIYANAQRRLRLPP